MTPARITEAFAVREVCDYVDGRQKVELLEPLEYRFGDAETGDVIIVPAGFVTDFASIPWGFRNTFPPLGRHARPAIIHDFLYRVRGQLPEAMDLLDEPEPMLSAAKEEAYDRLIAERPEANARTYDRAQADAVFREAMAVVGVAAWRREIMYRAVRLGGGGGWGS